MNIFILYISAHLVVLVRVQVFVDAIAFLRKKTPEMKHFHFDLGALIILGYSYIQN